MHPITRRAALGALGVGALGALSLATPAGAAPAGRITKAIPSTGARIPVIGMGTWQTFNVGDDPALRAARTEVLRTFLALGGGLVDSSPMYGSSQAVVGHALAALKSKAPTERALAADKIWTSDGDETRAQLEETRRRWGVARFDVMQIHNLLAWKPHLEALRALKGEGVVSHIGITTSHGRRHGELAAIMASETIDCVQLTYDITHREAEKRLLPLAAERGIAVIVNRPYDGGASVERLRRSGARVPEWAAEADIRDWPGFLLKWIVSHPAVTVAIPATTRVDHMRENMAAGYGRLPDDAMRARMAKHIASL